MPLEIPHLRSCRILTREPLGPDHENDITEEFADLGIMDGISAFHGLFQPTANRLDRVIRRRGSRVVVTNVIAHVRFPFGLSGAHICRNILALIGLDFILCSGLLQGIEARVGNLDQIVLNDRSRFGHDVQSVHALRRKVQFVQRQLQWSFCPAVLGFGQ